MPRPKKKRNNMSMQYSRGNRVATIYHQGIPEKLAPLVERDAADFAKKHEINLKIVKAPSRSTVSLSGSMTQKQWDAIFKKKRKGKK